MRTNAPLHTMMQNDEIDLDGLAKTLADNFNVLADEVQSLSDRKTILEHKLRFAHEQYQHLADKYAPSDPAISATLAKLQLPPELKLRSPDRATFVPLPSRQPSGSKQQTAEAIRDGRRASKRIASLRGWRNPSDAENRSTSGTTDSIVRTSRLGTSATSIFEQDFTVPGKRSELLCPFSKMANKSKLSDNSDNPRPATNFVPGHNGDLDAQLAIAEAKSPIHLLSADPICVALYSESHPSPPPSVTGSAAKCPIRFLDQHSPEEVARYFETHKHEIPRSHEVCVKRYQRNEEDIRKLDAKYGNLVSMISGLGQKHQPMFQGKEDDFVELDDRKSNERVQRWAKTVSAGDAENANSALLAEDDEDREGRFDRPMKEVRVGESPSRPWGISVPYVDPTFLPDDAGKQQEPMAPPSNLAGNHQNLRGAKKCPFDHSHKQENGESPQTEQKAAEGFPPQPVFIQEADLGKVAGSTRPQMLFTGPVFIGYPIEQAMVLMQQWQAGMNTNGKP